ncbi:Folate synthesis bifunctional protein [Hondaea fermentalgiana]|uniref:Folate synthesis bifunctional protein n=1 Tax=Hondaea fermentalgiana TaxID=2315210 RepID=A0A2R5G0Z6_9STRA|nr:Folate synthesis bifunctional protein [Hondaea fermentalgiana]|eukprot:GBG23969.1 Folate synthesis bifunctional protein [Hondaea fermentalgiana]
MRRTALVALGSNQGPSLDILTRAVRRVGDACGRLTDCSHMYKSKAQLVENQPDFYNAVIAVQTSLDAPDLLKALQEIETGHAKSSERFGPRELDLDLIAFADGEQIVPVDAQDYRQLAMPHPRAHMRDFVVRPLCDMPIGRRTVLGNGARAEEMLNATPDDACIRVDTEQWAAAETASDAPLLMGVLNITPDSFSDGGSYVNLDKAVEHALRLQQEGAHVIDVGGESTRPNALDISPQEEQDRVLPVIEALRAHPDFSARLSIDTRHVSTAREAIAAGAHIINDEVGELDDEAEDMLRAAGDLGVPLMTMHSRGDARTMEKLKIEDASVDMTTYVKDWLCARATRALQAHGVPRWNVMIDPGLGFAKTHEQNIEILARTDELVETGYPVLIGTSRKRFVRQYTTFDIDVTTAATSTAAVLAGARMVRVHSIPHAVDVVSMAHALRQQRRRGPESRP